MGDVAAAHRAALRSLSEFMVLMRTRSLGMGGSMNAPVHAKRELMSGAGCDETRFALSVYAGVIRCRQRGR
jgi:hypothetical protein